MTFFSILVFIQIPVQLKVHSNYACTSVRSIYIPHMIYVNKLCLCADVVYRSDRRCMRALAVICLTFYFVCRCLFWTGFRHYYFQQKRKQIKPAVSVQLLFLHILRKIREISQISWTCTVCKNTSQEDFLKRYSNFTTNLKNY